MRSILVVEDEPAIARIARDYLEQAGFEVRVVGDGNAALSLARTSKPDLIVLDGLDVTRELRKSLAIPIVMLTARGDETDRIVGLELGADDYMVKPFSPKELVARVRAVLRRSEMSSDARSDVLHVGDLEAELSRMRLSVAGRQVELTATEFQLITTLMREPGRVFTRSQLLDAVHGEAVESFDRAIDAHVKNLRRKIEPVPASPRYILTVHGVGYRFADA